MQMSDNRDLEMANASFRIDDDLKAKVDRLSEATGVNPSVLFRSALERVVEEAEEEGDGLKLSLLERLMLRNQYRILEILMDDDCKPAIFQQILEEGYKSQYHQLVRGFDPCGKSVAAGREVLDILEMHRHMRDAFVKSGRDNDMDESAIVFRGFDGNEEGEQLAFTRYYLEILGRYLELRRESYNSHRPMLPTYRRMLDAWNKRAEIYMLTGSELRTILEAEPN